MKSTPVLSLAVQVAVNMQEKRQEMLLVAIKRVNRADARFPYAAHFQS
jgi:hypothetical protein